MTMLPLVKPLESGDYPAVLALNEASVQFTSPLYMDELDGLVGEATYARGIGEPLQGFLLAMDPHSAYESVNYLWFRARHSNFLYIDRIVIGEGAQGKGLGRALYADLFAFARGAGIDRICCEINFDPPNHTSDAFHKALGFEETGRAVVNDGKKTVRYMEKTI